MSDRSPAERLYHKLMRVEELSGLDDGPALKHVGQLIDVSGDVGKLPGLERALQFCSDLDERDLTSRHRSLLHYFWSNALESRRLLHRDGWETRAWEQPELEEQTFHLRQALQLGEGDVLSQDRYAQILTNLGNVISHHGRLPDAIEYWDRALGYRSQHAMARGNRGYGLYQYGWYMHGSAAQAVFVLSAYQDLTAALEREEEITDSARELFRRIVGRIKDAVRPELLESGPPIREEDLGESEEEVAYRTWCLENRLMLHPLNALGPISMAGTDDLRLPPIATGVHEGPYLVGFFDQMKQEFASARYFLYRGSTSESPHFSDRPVTVADTGDAPTYSFAAEQAKMAFRAAYAVLDKVAFFLNDYLELGYEDRQVGFRRIWRKGDEIHPRFQGSRNIPLLGLYWIAKEFQTSEALGGKPISPTAREARRIRNRLEHRYLRLHETSTAEKQETPLIYGGRDPLSYRVSRSSFEDHTLRLFKLVRSALICLCHAVYVEEGGTGGQSPGDEGPGPVVNLPPIDFDQRT